MQHLLWGDWLRPLGPIQGEWVEVRARVETGWMHRDDIQEDRLLEVNFVDIGQGDGCLIVTPEDKFIVIDAGEGDNMYRFLRWRFGGFKERFTFESAVITHPDRDHYGGFKPLFEAGNVYFGTIFHNGIVERKEKETLGPRTKTGRPHYLTDVISDQEALQTIIGNPEKTGKKFYPNLLKIASDSGRVGDIRRKLTPPLNLPAPGRRQTLYFVSFTLQSPMFLVNSRLGQFTATPSSSGREVLHPNGAPLLPKLRG